MRRYTVDVSGHEFVIDVQEQSADRFDVFVDGQSFSVTLSGEYDLATASIGAAEAERPQPLPSVQPSQPLRSPPRPAPPRATQPGARSAPSPAALNAPMPGVILELFVQAGDTVKRGQQVAVLDAMKMHNFIGAPRDGTVSEVCVSAGQAVGHGDTILRFAEG